MVLHSPSGSLFIVEFKLRLSALFFMALGEKSAGCVWGGCVCDKFSSLLLLFPMMCSDLALLCSLSGSEDILRSRLYCMAALLSSWLTVAPCGGDDGDVNRASSTNFSVKLGWWFGKGVDCCCCCWDLTILCTCANWKESNREME